MQAFKNTLTDQLMDMRANDAAEYLQRLEAVGALDLSPLETVLMQHLIGQTEECQKLCQEMEVRQ